MRIAFLVLKADGMGGTERSVITQANSLVTRGHDVRLISVVREKPLPHFPIDPRIKVDWLTVISPGEGPGVPGNSAIDVATARRLLEAPSLLVPPSWDSQFSALTDVALESYLPGLKTDLLVTVTPALLASAVQLARRSSVLVHQEHRPSSFRTSGMECLLAFAPRADLVACLTNDMASWLGGQLGARAPEIVVMPNALPLGFTPRSDLDQPLILAAGRLVEQKQFVRLVRAFAQVADRIPEWRLRIVGEGPHLNLLRRQVRRSRLWDRVELPGPAGNMQAEWARASICALTSRDEGLPLVLQEAMAAGLAIASVDCVTGPRDLIRHEENGLLVPPASEAGMGAALLRLATEEPLRRRLGDAAYESSRRFLPDLIAERWIAIYEAALRDRDRPRLERRAVESGLEHASRSAVEPEADPAHAPQGTPAEARSRLFATVSGLAAELGTAWFALPPDGESPATVVLPVSDRDEFLQQLPSRNLPGFVELVDPGDDGWPERHGEVADLAHDLRRGCTSRILLQPRETTRELIDRRPVEARSYLAQGCTVGVEFWPLDADGNLISPGHTRLIKSVPADGDRATSVLEGVEVPMIPELSGRLVSACDFEIDAVYTWVDGSDPRWNEARLRRLAEADPDAHELAASGPARYESRDELRYSLRSLHLFAPWIHRIHVVTDGQVPAWLSSHPRVSVVDHSTILPPEALPTFNSHAIETALHRIPGLSEHFLYFNDDMMLGRPVTPELFFTPSGMPRVFFADHPIGVVRTDDPPYLRAGDNNRRLLRDEFGVTITRTLAHSPYPHRRSVLETVEERFAEPVKATRLDPFRSGSDVSFTSSLAQHFGLITGTAIEGSAEMGYINLASSNIPWKLQNLLQRETDFFCIADHHHHALRREQLNPLLERFLVSYFPVAAAWEK